MKKHRGPLLMGVNIRRNIGRGAGMAHTKTRAAPGISRLFNTHAPENTASVAQITPPETRSGYHPVTALHDHRITAFH
jgi:hypothetical protein